ncbi:LOW QUALITY PROTEIN: KAP domain-containing protein [Cephalotus follicularis]|uniref:KAP domain-containing protein n=1 Tax=Cephalotus follicularis TaxID=3775 RepID=A0A1Q3CG24_CEPFO|nr:LOW QUALITY PROTEIN: KAP domain-containing protein [Cephalotus follicularis]
MHNSDSRSFSQLVSELQITAEEVASLAKNSASEREIFNEFATLLDKLTLVLDDINHNNNLTDTPTVRKAVESFKEELKRGKALIQGSNSRSPIKHIEDITQDIGRSLGLVLFASHDLQVDIKAKIGALHRELMNARFNASRSPSLSVDSIFASESESDKGTEAEKETKMVNEIQEVNEIEEERISISMDDVALQLKYGNGEEFKLALLGLYDIKSGLINKEWIDEEEIIPILFNRLGSRNPNNQLTVVQILRSLAWRNAENKEKMADAGYLSVLVKCLTRGVEERREAVGLLLDISDIPAVRRRLGRIHGCIVMLVTMINGDDPAASYDAGKLLNSLSSNTQNALHMAEAGYFKPLVHYLKKGSDMCKILMATALSRMELTDQSLASLGGNGAIEALVKMFKAGKLEAKLSALSALQNLSKLPDNILRLISSGIVVPLLQLLFSVTSVLMTLREPASVILARIAQSESILVNQDVAQQMLSLLNLSNPLIQYHLLQALNSICVHSSASKVRRKMKENGAIQLLLPFLHDNNTKIRTVALNLLCNLSKDLTGELTEQIGEKHLNVIVNIIATTTSESEKAAAVGILSNLPISDKQATDILYKANLLPLLISIMNSLSANSTATKCWIAESVAGVLIRFTVPSEKKLQLQSVEHGAIPVLVNLLSSGSIVAKCRAATSLAQLSQNSLSLAKSRKDRWLCVSRSAHPFCEVHEAYCFGRNTICLVEAGALSPLLQILEGDKREADEAVLNALATLLQDEIWENGSTCIAKMSGVQAIAKVLDSRNIKAQEKALWMLERIFRVEEHRVQYGETAHSVLIDLAQNGDPRLRPTVAKLLAQLEFLQNQSSYF